MTRKERIKLLVDLIEFVEGVVIAETFFEGWSDSRIERELDFYDYVADK